jgi:hypothetical protein
LPMSETMRPLHLRCACGKVGGKLMTALKDVNMDVNVDVGSTFSKSVDETPLSANT